MAVSRLQILEIKDLVVNVDMENILREYPATCIPHKFHPRTGKAKNAYFEKINSTLYEESASIATFYTSEERLLPWLRALEILYFDNIGKMNEVKITWHDHPENWDTPDNIQNSVIIEVIDAESNSLLYNVTVFVTTGTIRIQGKSYELFTNYHFPLLLKLVELITEPLQHSPSMCENDPNNNTHVKQLLSPTHTRTQEEDEASICKPDLIQHMQRLERGVVDGLDKLGQSGRNNLCELLDAIKDCKKNYSAGVTHCKREAGSQRLERDGVSSRNCSCSHEGKG